MRFLTGAITLAALLQACAGQAPAPQPEASVAERAAYTPAPGLSDKSRFRQVLVNLEAGEPAQARNELMLYLTSQPTSDVGLDLLQQIDLPANEYFPSDYRVIALEPGWSLSTVAQHYLGSVYQFHALAKYNDIPEPRKLRAGQQVRIPLTPHAAAVFNEIDAGVAAPSAMDTTPADSAPETGFAEPLPELPEALPADGEFPVKQDAAAGAGDADIGAAAADAEASAVAADPEVVEQLHRDALNAYRAQDLDSAIALWSEVLALDPGHQNASLYQAQAIELKRKLSSLAN
ncbi:MAG: LysM peptidoglycan-binding domain-containing protein [Halioglobus sp.]|nr:LysM peptidoglycan-binding domain-containing protein [Halioglobus sp.]